MRATNDIKVHPLTAYFYISNEFLKPNFDDIGYLSLIILKVLATFLLYIFFFFDFLYL